MSQPITVITGAVGGLGSELTDVLLTRGHRVAALDRLAEPVSDRAAESKALLRITMDATDSAAWQRALTQVESAFGLPTSAVLAAGGWAGGVDVADDDDAVYRRMMELNLESARLALRAILPKLVAQRAGSIVVIGSRAVERPWESGGAAAYAASKAALVAYARAAASEVLDTGVRVNAVLPSVIDTPANRAAMPSADASRWVTPRSLSQVIAFLLSDEARDVSGAVIPVYARV